MAAVQVLRANDERYSRYAAARQACGLMFSPAYGKEWLASGSHFHCSVSARCAASASHCAVTAFSSCPAPMQR